MKNFKFYWPIFLIVLMVLPTLFDGERYASTFTSPFQIKGFSLKELATYQDGIRVYTIESRPASDTSKPASGDMYFAVHFIDPLTSDIGLLGSIFGSGSQFPALLSRK